MNFLKENNNKICRLTFDTFRLLKKGDKVYYKEIKPGGNFELKEYEIIFAKWFYSGENCISKKTLKPFWYYQIISKKGVFKKYCDSAGHNYNRVYIKKDLLRVLETRKKRR